MRFGVALRNGDAGVRDYGRIKHAQLHASRKETVHGAVNICFRKQALLDRGQERGALKLDFRYRPRTDDVHSGLHGIGHALRMVSA